ncbi:MAG: PorV/PorQ family protein [bacterium]
MFKPAKQHISLAVAIILTCQSLIFAAPGENAAEFLNLGVGGRPIALAEAFTAIVDDPMLAHYNPAGLATINESKLTLMHNEHIQKFHYSYMGFVLPLRTQTPITLAASVYHMSARRIHEYDYLGNRMNNITAYDAMATLSYSMECLYSFLLGANIKFLKEKLYTKSANQVFGDVGFLHITMIPYLTFGGVLQNIGSSMKYTDESFPLPRKLKFGFGYQPPFLARSTLLLLETNKTLNEKSVQSIGFEINTCPLLSIRTGYKSRKDLDSKFSFGIGLNLQKLKIDYSTIPYGALGDSHVISLEYMLEPIRKSHGTQVREEKSEILYNKAQNAVIEGNRVEALELLKQSVRTYPKNNKAKSLQNEIAEDLYEEVYSIYKYENKIEDAIKILQDIKKNYSHAKTKKLLKKLLKENKK